MSQKDEKIRQEASLIGKILSMETLIFVMGCFMLIAGFREGNETSIFWGVIILIGFVILRFVRRKDWAKHFAEMEAEHKAAQRRDEASASGPQDGKNEP